MKTSKRGNAHAAELDHVHGLGSPWQRAVGRQASNAGQALALIALARKIGLRRGRRLAGLAADGFLAYEALRRHRRQRRSQGA